MRYGRNFRDHATFSPGHIGGNDQRGDLPGSGARGDDCLGGVAAKLTMKSPTFAAIWNRDAQSLRYQR